MQPWWLPVCASISKQTHVSNGDVTAHAVNLGGYTEPETAISSRRTNKSMEEYSWMKTNRKSRKERRGGVCIGRGRGGDGYTELPSSPNVPDTSPLEHNINSGGIQTNLGKFSLWVTWFFVCLTIPTIMLATYPITQEYVYGDFGGKILQTFVIFG